MELGYKMISDRTDEAHHTRATIEEAEVPGEGWIIRSTVYTEEKHVASGEIFVPDYSLSRKVTVHC